MKHPADPLSDYRKAVEREIKAGNATEHSFRPALKALLQGLAPGVLATNEPKRIKAGAPDYIVSRTTGHGLLTVGYLEAKDVGSDLDQAEKSDQLRRYRTLPNLVLTDYLEFRWYVDGQRRLSASLGQLGKRRTVTWDASDTTEQLLRSFLEHEAEPITSAKDLAQRMAHLAQNIREVILGSLQTHTASATLRDLQQAIEKALIPDLSDHQFADLFSQTIAYGLFAARTNHAGASRFLRLGAAAEIPKTNPLLRQLFNFIAGPDLDEEPYVGFVDDLVQLLADTDMDTVLADFGRRTRQQDPVVHFYETFLGAYDPELRDLRGVYYTPEPVVSYIVRSVNYLLQEHFALPQGLSDTSTVQYTRVRRRSGKTHQEAISAPRVLILDPACGTGTFLYRVVDEIRAHFIEQRNAGIWSGYVREHLLPRLLGFELLMAPYAVAHLKLALQLAAKDLRPTLRDQWKYDFAQEDRLRVFLTNTLDEAERHAQYDFGFLRTLTDESNASIEVKAELPIMVVIGNPPYSVSSANTGPWVMSLLEDYKQTIKEEEVQIQAVSNDYIKFIRFAHWRIARTGRGIIGFITNNGYLGGPLFRDMRRALLTDFDELFILNLHGSTRWKEKAPDGSTDKNVFDIQQGVAIILMVRCADRRAPCRVRYADLWGSREVKYDRLEQDTVATTLWTTITPTAPAYSFAPKPSGGSEYATWWSVLDVFGSGCRKADRHKRYGAGFATQQDDFAISFTQREVKDKVSVLCDESLSEAQVREKFRLCTTNQWNFHKARLELRKGGWTSELRKVTYRPFDVRWTAYVAEVVSILRWAIMRHLLVDRANVALVTTRIINGEPPAHVFVSERPVEKIALSAKTSNNAFVFPLYIYEEDIKKAPRFGATHPVRRPNLNPAFIRGLSERLGLSFVSDGHGDFKVSFGPEDVLRYVYAILHSPTYRSRYAESLKTDFPRVPLIADAGLFRTLCEKGAELVSLHLMHRVGPTKAAFPVKGTNMVEKVRYAQGGVWINDSQFFDGVPESVWQFRVGGYQVCEKWLKDRKGRKLSHDDLVHYQGIVANVAETIRLMEEIDAAIPTWPLPSAEASEQPLPLVAEGTPQIRRRKSNGKAKRRR